MCTYEDLVAATLPLRPGTAGRPAAQDDHRRRRRHRRRHRVDVVPQRADPRRHRRDGRAHRRRRDRHRRRRTASTPTCSTDSRIPTAPSATRPGCGSDWNGSSPLSRLRHLRFTRLDDLQAAIDAIVDDPGSTTASPVDYLDGVVFSRTESYLTLGTLHRRARPDQRLHRAADLLPVDSAAGTDRLTIHDYLWRWDTDWFWCSRAFGAQQPLVRRLWPKRLRRSSFYWKLVALDRRFGIADRIERLHHRPPLERVVQDIEVPVDRTAEFVDWFLDNVPIEPIWLCPLRLPADPSGRRPTRPGRSTRSRPSRPTSTSASGRWCRCSPGAGGRDQPADRAEGQRPGRAQIAVLRRLLHAGVFRRPLRRRNVCGS